MIHTATITLTKEKETKNTYMYRVVSSNGVAPFTDRIYIQKWVIERSQNGETFVADPITLGLQFEIPDDMEFDTSLLKTDMF